TFPTGFQRYLRFDDVNGGSTSSHVVKVFQFEVDLGLASNPSGPSFRKTFHFAMECQEPPSGQTIEDITDPRKNRIPLRDPCHPEIVGCYVYRLRYQNVQILALIVGDDLVSP